MKPHFEGHFPGNPIMPGVLVVEAIAQTAAVLVVHTLALTDVRPLVYLMTVDKCKFRKLVKPGDVLELHVEVLRSRGRIWRVSGRGVVAGQIVAEAVIDAMMVSDRGTCRVGMTIDPSSNIHASAVVEPGATIGPGCRIGPYCVIGP